uniref:Uncharacterized protein n=1 Tax=Arundo donax TaxID=35708 RepID=A0A0A9FKE2_ARUDO
MHDTPSYPFKTLVCHYYYCLQF